MGCGPSLGPSARRCLSLRQAQSLSPISPVHAAQRGAPPRTLGFLGPGSPFPPSSGQPSLLTHCSRVTPASAHPPLPPSPPQPPSAGQPCGALGWEWGRHRGRGRVGHEVRGHRRSLEGQLGTPVAWAGGLNSALPRKTHPVLSPRGLECAVVWAEGLRCHEAKALESRLSWI